MFESLGSGFELMHECVCGILCLLLAPTRHLAMVILIKVVQVFILLDAFSQVLLKCLHLSSMTSKK